MWCYYVDVGFGVFFVGNGVIVGLFVWYGLWGLGGFFCIYDYFSCLRWVGDLVFEGVYVVVVSWLLLLIVCLVSMGDCFCFFRYVWVLVCVWSWCCGGGVKWLNIDIMGCF